ncbi:MAG: hypothetical protein R2838_22235 [Caldilineaceae bacterium]
MLMVMTPGKAGEFLKSYMVKNDRHAHERDRAHHLCRTVDRRHGHVAAGQRRSLRASRHPGALHRRAGGGLLLHLRGRGADPAAGAALLGHRRVAAGDQPLRPQLPHPLRKQLSHLPSRATCSFRWPSAQ